MWQTQCFSCTEVLNRVSIRIFAREHITRRHYPRSGYEPINEGLSMFLEDVMPSDLLFSTIIDELRSGLTVPETQRQPDSLIRYVYFYRFGFIIGSYPNRQGGSVETDMVKIVSNTTECQVCHRRWPSEVVTSYPCKTPVGYEEDLNPVLYEIEACTDETVRRLSR